MAIAVAGWWCAMAMTRSNRCRAFGAVLVDVAAAGHHALVPPIDWNPCWAAC
jgi:hypothetical protein